MDNTFLCKNKQLSDYLIKHGSKLIRIDTDGEKTVYVFSFDDTINDNLDKWEIDRKRCLF